MNKETKIEIEKHLTEVMEKFSQKHLVKEHFDEKLIENKNPFGFRLMPIDVWKGSKLERSFVTTLGQGIFEQIAKIIAIGSGANAINQHSVEIELSSAQVDKINSILKEQRKSKKNKGSKKKGENLITIREEVENVNQYIISDRLERVELIFDLFIERDNRKEYYSMKTVKPNLDQTEKAKKEMLLIMASETDLESYFALPYNPAGEGNSYRKAKHSPPYKLFNMDDEEFVLIGAEFWNKIGNSQNTYDELLDIFETVGNKYVPLIKNEYFA